MSTILELISSHEASHSLEQRRSEGVHYTPPELAAHTVDIALDPVLGALGPAPTSADILSTKICDPACGAGVFLVAATERLSRALADAYSREGVNRDSVADVARSCIFGVDISHDSVDIAREILVSLGADSDSAAEHVVCGDSLFCLPAGMRCFVGNPPFIGGAKISTNFGADYLRMLQETYGKHGLMDYCGYFFRAAWDALDHGSIGFIATKTIAEGGSRRGSLKYIVESGGIIYHAEPRKFWPGEAQVLISTVWIAKGIEADYAISKME